MSGEPTPSQDLPKPSPDEALPQPDRETRPLGSRDVVNKLTELLDSPIEGAKWVARIHRNVRPTPATPNSPYPEHWQEGKIGEDLLVAEAHPESPRVYTSHSSGDLTSYTEGEQVKEVRSITRDEAGEIKGVGREIEHSIIYHQPEVLTDSGSDSIIGKKVTLGSTGRVRIDRILMEQLDERQGPSFHPQTLEDYNRGDPEGQKIVKELIEDLDASVNHTPTQPAPSA